jgi:Na+-translocating ferredoxin:NAD+ oxidoreductase subunit D
MLITSAPHIKDKDNIVKIMWTVNFALLPALCGSIYFFGMRALLIILTAIITCCITESLACILMKKKNTIYDGSAIATAILLSFNLPPSIPLWMVAIGSIVAIGIVKMCFGGLGANIFNPALVGRAFLLACFPVQMTTWNQPQTLDGITCATPLGIVKDNLINDIPSYFNLFIGNQAGCIGETSALLLIIGGIILLLRKCITWHIPVSFIGTVALMYLLFGNNSFGNPLFGILTGGVMLGAIFMATDMVTSPATIKGQLIFGCSIGLLTCLIRFKGGYPEGVSYSILIMNMMVPLIDRYLKPKRF